MRGCLGIAVGLMVAAQALAAKPVRLRAQVQAPGCQVGDAGSVSRDCPAVVRTQLEVDALTGLQSNRVLVEY
ncbi:hypothetical protein [Jeongeupia sp. USM3]|uniref:hypothetical protein n=1 Tax=Jeongeupia sp. USM3 TaxID=1906741 RepID=UPI00089E0719|nr:hypothetical protein [Jeongeupia sp. USM3]AOY02048.1 hypothetical protein BJP62_17335 [Jeongeupia sp. USM3]